MVKDNILVVDGESGLLELVRHNLPRDAYQVKGVLMREKALAEATDTLADLIVIDLMPPGQGGLNVCRELKINSKTSHIPIIVFATKAGDSDIAAGLELGADGYLTSPLSPRVLQTMVRVVLRKKRQQADFETAAVNINGLTVDPVSHNVILNGAALTLTATEFALLHFLVRRPGRVLTRDQITRSVKGRDYPATDRSVDVQIVALRRKLGDAGALIETVRGIGYKFRESARSKKKIA